MAATATPRLDMCQTPQQTAEVNAVHSFLNLKVGSAFEDHPPFNLSRGQGQFLPAVRPHRTLPPAGPTTGTPRSLGWTRSWGRRRRGSGGRSGRPSSRGSTTRTTPGVEIGRRISATQVIDLWSFSVPQRGPFFPVAKPMGHYDKLVGCRSGKFSKKKTDRLNIADSGFRSRLIL